MRCGMTASTTYNVASCTLVAANCALVNGKWYVTAQPANTELPGIAQAGVKEVLCVRNPDEAEPQFNPPFDFDEVTILLSEGVPYINMPFTHGMTQAQFN